MFRLNIDKKEIERGERRNINEKKRREVKINHVWLLNNVGPRNCLGSRSEKTEGRGLSGVDCLARKSEHKASLFLGVQYVCYIYIYTQSFSVTLIFLPLHSGRPSRYNDLPLMLICITVVFDFYVPEKGCLFYIAHNFVSFALSQSLFIRTFENIFLTQASTIRFEISFLSQ